MSFKLRRATNRTAAASLARKVPYPPRTPDVANTYYKRSSTTSGRTEKSFHSHFIIHGLVPVVVRQHVRTFRIQGVFY